MSIDKRWILLLAVTVSAAVSAAFASRSRHPPRRSAHVQHKEDVKSWENEGGNLAPTAVSPGQP
jgi:hypothetical protein